MIVWFELTFCAGLPESVTFTVTGDEPAAVGVPLTVQPVSVKPAGNVPVIEQEYAGVPSLAVIVELYGTPTVPPGKVLVIVNAAGAMTMVSFALTFCVGLPESVTFTVTGEEPCVVGVPLTVQPVRLRPAGNAPVIEHEYGVTPPVAPIIALYGTPTVPFGNVFVRARAAGAIVMVWFALAFCAGLPASVAFTRTVTLPAVVGVPLTVQPVRLNPAGSAPVIEQA
jgi:hypothetical protein